MDSQDETTYQQCSVQVQNPDQWRASGWVCEMFGCGQAMVFTPTANYPIPNRFQRWMQWLCFGNRWHRVGE